MVRAWVNHYGAMHATLKSSARSRAAVDTGKYREVSGGESAGNAIVATSPKPASTTFISSTPQPAARAVGGKPRKIEGSPPMAVVVLN